MAREIDWERVELEYRAGQFSIREIARQHSLSDGAIRKKAKENGWTRDLTEKVREAVRIKAVRNAVRTDGGDGALTDEQIVEVAAERGAQVIGRHQAILGEGRDLCERLLKRVRQAVENIEASEKPKTQAAKMQDLAIASRTADLLQGLIQTASKVIPLERQAFNLGADYAPGESKDLSIPDDPIEAAKAYQKIVGGT